MEDGKLDKYCNYCGKQTDNLTSDNKYLICDECVKTSKGVKIFCDQNNSMWPGVE